MPVRHRLLVLPVLAFALGSIFHAQAASQAPTAEQAEFFEKKVRPLLVQHCHSCHSAEAKKVRGGLRVDSREALLKGGDSGPAIVPGQSGSSRLIEAVKYANVEMQMPPKGKLSQAAIADLTKWVDMGAPWPSGTGKGKEKTEKTFDLAARKAAHWSWRPVKAGPPPTVKDTAWPGNGIDRFILAGLEEKGLKPAPAADRRTLIRRLTFDLTGLPPTPEEVEAFIGDTSGKAIERAVDRLLNSPRFGERWGRHWLDLVRYAETRGHEFDYNIPGAYHYRDMIIRAFNADVPYNQLAVEHIAGDLLPRPRLHPEKGHNESQLATAFWFLGEECHSPVDIRADQADRFDNRIDVLAKTFLGLTVACARCHDHKFDAISTKDYYALYGFLSSSNYRLARFESWEANRQVARDLDRLRAKHLPAVGRTLGEMLRPGTARAAGYLRGVGEVLKAAGRGRPGWSDIDAVARARRLDAEALRRWLDCVNEAVRDDDDPLHPLARVLTAPKGKSGEVLQPILARWKQPAPAPLSGKVVIDYRRPLSTGWLPDDVAFGSGPVRAGEIQVSGSSERSAIRFSTDSAATLDPFWREQKLSIHGDNDPGALGQVVRAGRTLSTPTFRLDSGRVHYLVRGVGVVYASVGSHVMIAGPLHGRLVKRVATGKVWQWITHDLSVYKGQNAHLEFSVPPGNDLAIACVTEGERAPTTLPMAADSLARIVQGANSPETLIAGYGRLLSDVAAHLSRGPLTNAADAACYARLADWIVQHGELFGLDEEQARQALAKEARPLLKEQAALASRVQRESMLAPVMLDGSPVDETVFIRGSHRAAGPVVSRRFLTALGGEETPYANTGSGRLELARQITDPARNPFISRVMVNRIWHHLLGRGIVPSVDDFGVMGQPPTHPELLDWLADRFVKEGWSVKKMIRLIVLSRTYQQASVGDPETEKRDPENRLWHRASLRRLQAEAVRDSLLALSGQLDTKMYGPSIPVHLTEFQQGRGRPGSGPLDGAGRRSIYLSVRRNFLSSFMLAFDAPQPFSTVGKRTVSNVPAQSLILMNDPFVHQQASAWARRMLKEPGTARERIVRMYTAAFARPPCAEELASCLDFIGGSNDEAAWADLAHALINVKEFIYLS